MSRKSNSSRNVIIVGGGIGGLAAALALERQRIVQSKEGVEDNELVVGTERTRVDWTAAQLLARGPYAREVTCRCI